MNPFPPRVLIVDDEWPIRMLLARMLKNWGYRVLHVGSALEALDAMSKEPADILLCDVVMPEHNGLWLLGQVHTQWPGTAIIMATGCQDAPTIQTSRRSGAIAYVTKPFNPYALRDAVGQAAAFRQALASTPA